MVRHLTAHDALVDREARAHNAKLIAAPGGRDTPIHLLAGGSGVGRPKQRTCSGQVVAPKPVASAYQRASVPPMAPRALAQPAYFEDLGPLLEPLQVRTTQCAAPCDGVMASQLHSSAGCAFGFAAVTRHN